MATVPLTIRSAAPEDAAALSALHAAAWRYSYRGIIPGLVLERMIAARGTGWWRRAWRDVLLLEFDGVLAGYASCGRSRVPIGGAEGEITEIYLAPAYQGTGLGRELFGEAREALRQSGLRGCVVWALSENTAARRFYRAMGGEAVARSSRRVGGERLPVTAYTWP